MTDDGVFFAMKATLIFAASLVSLVFLVAMCSDSTFRDKCEAAGGIVHSGKYSPTLCIKKDSLIEIEGNQR